VTAYVDASVILRLALGQPNRLAEWSKIQRGVSSALITTESLRTLDRLRLRAKLSDVEVATRRAAILSLIGSLELVELDAVVLDRARRRCRPSSERWTLFIWPLPFCGKT
jgi:predicted nucleic acid-binding protein